MSEDVYAVVAYIARYWFAFLIALILLRAVLWLREDTAAAARAKRKLPDAGFIGEWVVVASQSGAMPEGAVLRAPREGFVGGARACDVPLRDREAPARAARFALRADGLHLTPRRRGTVLVDGEPVLRRAVLRHGATLTVGGTTLELRLFAGVLLTGETPARPGRGPKRGPGEAGGTKMPEAPRDGGTLPSPALTLKMPGRRRTRGTRSPEA